MIAALGALAAIIFSASLGLMFVALLNGGAR